MHDHWWEHIASDPLTMAGTPLVNGVPVWQVLQTFNQTLTADDVLRAYPQLTKDDLHAALACAAATFHATPR
jgi:uncharacterized protein (DUF433 family)